MKGSAVCVVANMWLATRAENLVMGWDRIIHAQVLRNPLGIPEQSACEESGQKIYRLFSGRLSFDYFETDINDRFGNRLPVHACQQNLRGTLTDTFSIEVDGCQGWTGEGGEGIVTKADDNEIFRNPYPLSKGLRQHPVCDGVGTAYNLPPLEPVCQ